MPRWRILLVIVIGFAAIVALWLLGAVLMSDFLRGEPAQEISGTKVLAMGSASIRLYPDSALLLVAAATALCL